MLRVFSYKSDKLLKRSDLRGTFWVCYACRKHWPRSAAIMRETARDGVKPKPTGL